METKNNDEYVGSIKTLLSYDNQFLVSPIGLSGGLALFWSNEITVEIISATPNYIDTHICYKGQRFYTTFVYGAPNVRNRQEVWRQISVFGMDRNIPWMLAGDFNDILVQEEKHGGPPRPESSFVDFRSFVAQNDLWDLNHSGNPLSWRGMRHDHLVHARLDRAMSNNSWIELFPSARMSYLRFEGSDHRPILVFLDNTCVKHRGLFRFDNRLREREEIYSLIEDVWSRHESSSVTNKLSHCRSAIITWSKEQNFNSAKLIRETQKKLDEALSLPTHDLVLVTELSKTLDSAYAEEEKYWYQRSRILWSHSGDRNSAFFHASTRNRRTLNRLTVMENEDGIACFQESDILKIISDYYAAIFKSNSSGNLGIVDEVLKPLVTTEWNNHLIAIPTDEEIRVAVFDIHHGKAPGPDGFSAGFYQSYWIIICKDLCHEVREFFANDVCPEHWNNTHIRLIPKVKDPSKASEYRPIALCNVFYKIIAKILTKRMHSVLPQLISDTQSAFVPDRAISDNVLITHEILHYLRLSKAKVYGSMAVKTDMSKAYDRIEWDFLQAVLRRLGFHDIWIKWIMTCVTSVTYSFLINGSAQGLVVPSRGLRQGDPLLPCLFILCTEVLSGLCRRAQITNQLPGVKINHNSPAVTNLLFADDTMFFCRSDESSCHALKDILATYEAASGQTINLNKSSITFSSKTSAACKNRVKGILRINQEGGTGKYLGLPENFGRRKRDIFTSIVDRIRQRSRSWSSRFLSTAGKCVMLKSVLSAMSNYAMSCFKIPASLCRRIQSILTRFWWDDKSDVRKISWVSWEKLTLPKNAGGLGFRDIEHFNDALLAKLSWRILTKPMSLFSRVLCSKYCHNSSFMECDLPKNASHGWYGILKGRDVLRQGLGWIIGPGFDINVWQDAWLSPNEPIRPIGPPTEANASLRVSDLINGVTREWKWDLIRLHIPVYRMIALTPNCLTDRRVWLPTKNGSYTTKSGYNVLMTSAFSSQPTDFNWQKNIWRVKSTPKIQHFLWKAMSGALPAGDQLAKRGLAVALVCKRCGRAETTDHILFHCFFALRVWELAPIAIGAFSQSPSIAEFLSAAKRFKNLPPTGLLDVDLYAWICWHLWKTRNKLIFENLCISEEELLFKAQQDSREWMLAQPLPDKLPNSTTSNPPITLQPGWNCFVDAAWDKTTSSCGIGSHFLHETSGACSDFVDSRRFVASPLAAETWAMKRSVEEAVLKGITKVLFHSDSLSLVSLLKSGDDRVEIANMLYDIRTICSEHDFSFSFIPRTANSVADTLAKQSLSDLLYSVPSFF